MIMTINDIPIKQDKVAIKDLVHQLSAEEFNVVVQNLKYVIGVELTKEQYDALVASNQVDPKARYFIVENGETDTPDTPDIPDIPDTPDDPSVPNSVTITMDWATYDNGTLIIQRDATYSNGTLSIG